MGADPLGPCGRATVKGCVRWNVTRKERKWNVTHRPVPCLHREERALNIGVTSFSPTHNREPYDTHY